MENVSYMSIEEYDCDLCGMLKKKEELTSFKMYFRDDKIEKTLITMCEKCKCGFEMDTCFTIEDEEGVILNQYLLDLVG